MRLLILRGRAEGRSENHGEAAVYFQRAARESRKEGDRQAEAESLLEAATHLSRAGSTSQARSSFNRAIGCFELLSADADVVQARLALARHELENREAGAARQQLERCVTTLEATEAWDELGWVHDQLSEISRDRGEVQTALDHAKAAVESAAKAKDRTRFGVRLAEVGSLHHLAGNFVKSRSYLKKALPYLQSSDNSEPLMRALLTLADTAEAMARPEEVLQNLEAALVTANAGGEPAQRGRIQVRLARMLGPKKAVRARTLLEGAVALLREGGDPRSSGSAWLALAAAQQRLDATEQAREALVRARAFFEMVGDTARVAEVATMQQAAEAGHWQP